MHGSTTSVPQTGIQSGATGDTTGGVQNYQGYVANVQGGNSTQSYKIQTRPKQTGTSNVNQDLVSTGASSSQSYAGAQILGSTVNPGAAQFVVGSTFTEDFTITMTAGGTYSLVSNLYAGVGTSGTLLVTTNGLDPTNPTPPAVAIGPFNYNGFDALAFGDRETDSLGDAIDVSSVTVQTNVAVSTPEPASLGLLAMGGMMLIARRRKA